MLALYETQRGHIQELLTQEVHIDVEARVGVPKSTIAETGMGVTSRPFRTRPNEF